MAKKPETSLLNDYHLLSYDVLDSTNEEAKRLAGGGGAHGAVIWAKRQTNGRGRMGRNWISAEGNFFVSLLLAPEAPLAKCPQLSFVTALAVAETLQGIVSEPGNITCKWPNDILASGKKLGGILLESFTGNEHGKPRHWVAVGVGINIDSAPEHVMFPATCLRDAGVEIISAKIVLSRFMHHFIQRYDQWANHGFEGIEHDWMKNAYHLGKPIEVIVGETQHEGTYMGIDGGGNLLLKDAKGKITCISAGDVFFKEMA
jgi:BirA family biotin operon repressor/biotin-[acetyl-CoA-carboxylase] ligase